MKRSIIIMAAALLYNATYTHRQHNLIRVSIKNSTDQTITIPTHEGKKDIPYGATHHLQMQRGQQYDIFVYDKKGAILGTTSEAFTPGLYFVKSEPDTASIEPNAVKLTVTKQKK